MVACQVKFLGDGYCDWANDKYECDYDNGDCKENLVLTTPSDCPKPIWMNDGVCDDFTNNEICNFDGGDCCLDPIDNTYCQQCKCYTWELRVMK